MLINIIFLKASDEFISEVLHPNAPLTQSEMNRCSAIEYQKEEARLNELNLKLLEALDVERKAKYKEVNEAGEKFFDLSVELEGMQYGQGTIRPTIENSAAARMSRERADQIIRLIDVLTNPWRTVKS